MLEPTPTEKEAILLRWRAENPSAPPDAGPTPEQAARLLHEIRERALAIENEMLGILNRKMRVRPTGGGGAAAVLMSRILIGVVAALLLIAAAVWAMHLIR